LEALYIFRAKQKEKQKEGRNRKRNRKRKREETERETERGKECNPDTCIAPSLTLPPSPRLWRARKKYGTAFRQKTSRKRDLNATEEKRMLLKPGFILCR